jgi:hypothetical protein
LKSNSDHIDRLARFVVSRGLAVPAVFFLEMNKPLSGISGQLLVVFEPLLTVFLKDASEWRKLFDSPDKIENIIRRIEKMSGVSAS